MFAQGFARESPSMCGRVPFKVQSLVFEVLGFHGFRVQGFRVSGFRAQGLRGLGRVVGSGLLASGALT